MHESDGLDALRYSVTAAMEAFGRMAAKAGAVEDQLAEIAGYHFRPRRDRARPSEAGRVIDGEWSDATPAVEVFVCPDCGATSPHPDDIEQRYCGRCHWPTGDPVLGPHNPRKAGQRALPPGDSTVIEES